MKQKFPAAFLYFLAAVLILNILQAAITELIFDEAYYWYYAKDLAWGYFDHPPMVAFLISLGSTLFNGELGVRLLSCLLGVGTMIILWLLIDNPKKKEYIPHFFVLILSMTLIQAYGFLMLPDTPLLFFTALFFLVYKKFINAPGMLISLFLGIVMAALMYSKYHAFLVIFFVLLSNLKLLKNHFAWVAVLVSLLCYTPHFLWLYENDFVSIKYHLFERPNRPYEFFDFTLGYFLNLLAIFGLTFPWIYKALIKSKGKDQFNRALLFVSYGILLFFLLSSLQRRVQTQWIILICIPMAVNAYEYMLEYPGARKWIVRLGLANIAILLFLRIGLVYEPLFPVVYETHGNKAWVGKITSQIGNIPVVFKNSYRMAPMFSYYSGNSSFSLNDVNYRENQYSIDESEEVVRGQKVLFVSGKMKEGGISFTMPDSTLLYGIYVNPFESFRKLKTRLNLTLNAKTDRNSSFMVYNPYSFAVPISKLKFGLVIMDSYKRVLEIVPVKALPKGEIIDLLAPMAEHEFEFTLPNFSYEKASYLKIVISENGLSWGLNGEKLKLD
ncbi:glycosyltransferase family 39 protein [uncultured Muriicola sp.]|uniref:glycosyltransferase family 39 protein n=1 Tax=uncultured Muriicola sp. TaxID=1583102 RepID=UPI00260A0747|nr:glycosyltransferase family 39 protein [uncultured Muriicola sp.]